MRRRNLKVGAFVLAAVMVLAACGGQSASYPEAEEYLLAADTVYPTQYIAEDIEYPEPATEEPPPEPRESPEPISCVTTMRLNENMPEFTFRRIVGDYTLEDARWDDWGHREVRIVIEDDAGNLIQEVAGIVQGQGNWFSGLESESFQPQFADFNFDGYLDMYLARHIDPGNAGFVDRYYWLWDAAQGQFILNEQLPWITGVQGVYANQETRQIEVRVRLHAVHHLQHRYEYHDGEFVLVATEEHDGWSFEHWEITHTNVITGEVTVETRPMNQDE